MKYSILEDDFKDLPSGIRVFRIRALHDFGKVKAGEIGGYVSDSRNLSHSGNCWIWDDAVASEFSKVQGDAALSGKAQLSGFAWIAGRAVVTDNALVTDYASVYNNGFVGGDAVLKGGASVFEDGYVFINHRKRRPVTMNDLATVRGKAKLLDFASMKNNALLDGTAAVRGHAALIDNARIGGDSQVSDWAVVSGNAWVLQKASIEKNSRIGDNAVVRGHSTVTGDSRLYCNTHICGRSRLKNFTSCGDQYICS